MDPDVVNPDGKDKFGGRFARTIEDDLKSLPTVSLVMDKDDWFGPQGIYINQSQDGTERSCSMEWIEPNDGNGFQIDCAIAMQGGVSGGGTSLNRWKVFKLSMRPRFKTTLDDGTPTGGPSELRFPLCPDSPVNSYQTIVLDALLANTWNHPSQHTHVNYLQDQFTADVHNAIGGHSPHGRFVHLYINGLYWGMYNLHERPDHAWAAEVFGGQDSQYDAMRHNASNVVNNGNGGSARDNFNSMLSAVNAVSSDPTSPTKYRAACRALDIDNFITDLIAHWYCLNWDWPDKNWYATRRCPDGPWRFHVWDAEHALEYWDSQNVLGKSVSGIHDKLKASKEYQMRFADIVQRSLLGNGPLTSENVIKMYEARITEISRAIVAEAARWGDARSATPHTPDEWSAVQEGVKSKFLQPRAAFILGWLRNAGLYPAVDAPGFSIGSRPSYGEYVSYGDLLTITVPAGAKVYYTIDGSDPRQGIGQDIRLLAADAIKWVKVPTSNIGTGWTALGYDHSGWQVVSGGPGGIGYDSNPGTGGDYRPYISYNLGSQILGRNSVCYVRIPFSLTAQTASSLQDMVLRLLYDDAVVVYLNGTEVYRAGISGTPAWNSKASSSRNAGGMVQEVDLTSRIGLLRTGQNILALQLINRSADDDDLLIWVELIGGIAVDDPEKVSSTAIQYAGPIRLDRSLRVRARAQAAGKWSAISEALFLVGWQPGAIRITEVMYHPISDPNAEFIELSNVGQAAVDLNFMRFTAGIDYTCGPYILQPGQYVLLVKDIKGFESAYGPGHTILGQYGGSLDNGGERIRLEDGFGQVVTEFTYDDGWYKPTDGAGYSLVLSEPTAGAIDLSSKQAWRQSIRPGGSPGRADQ